MPIIKIKPQDFFGPDGEVISGTFITVPSETIEVLLSAGKNGAGGTALLIANYLADKPEDWIIRRSDILKKLGIGRRRYDPARALLERAGMWHDETARNAENGMLLGHNVTFCIEVGSLKPSKLGHGAANATVGATDGHVIHRSDSPPCGERNHLHKNIVITQEHIPTQCSSDDSHVFEEAVVVDDGEENPTPPSEGKKAEPLEWSRFAALCAETIGAVDHGLFAHLGKNGWMWKGQPVDRALLVAIMQGQAS